MLHSLWSQGMKEDELRFFQKDNNDLTYANLHLVQATKYVIASGVEIISVSAPEEM